MSHDGVHRLFSDRDRVDPSPAAHMEGIHEFLDRVAGVYWQQVRDQMQQWFAHFPPAHSPDLIGRLRSKIANQFNGAYLELYLHEVFRRHGCSVECHPEVGAGAQRADFKVRHGASTFYVEARHVGAPSDAARGTAARTGAVYDTINSIRSPDFFVWIDVVRAGKLELRKGPLKATIERWLRSLDPDAADTDMQTHGIVSAHPFEWSDADWTIRLHPIVKSPAARGHSGDRLIGMYGGLTAEYVDDQTPIRDALGDKGAAYGDLGAPFIVALGVGAFSARGRSTMTTALHGSEQFEFSADHVRPVKKQRAPDGYWNGGGTWRHRNVSGVLQVTSLDPAFFHRADPTLWLHPAPDFAVEPLASWRCVRPNGATLATEDAVVAQTELFGVAEAWPHGDAFPHARPNPHPPDRFD